MRAPGTHRPVAVSMFFLGIVMLGIIAWVRLPVELLPPLEGNEIEIRFFRPGADPNIVEREIMIPLEGSLSMLEGLRDSRGVIRGSSGSLRLRFEKNTKMGLRQLELEQMAADLRRTQPAGSIIEVVPGDFSLASSFVMVVRVFGGADLSSLCDIAEERILPRLASLRGVSRVLLTGGASREVRVLLDPERCAAMNIQPSEVLSALPGAVGERRYLGSLSRGPLRRAVILDSRPDGPVELGERRIRGPGSPALRHIAGISIMPGRTERAYRVNGKPAIGLVVFQDKGANLVDLGRRLRKRVDEIRRESAGYGIDAAIGFDASEMVEAQLRRLKMLGISGFGIALLVLFLFLRRIEAVGVIAVAVPVSLLLAVFLLDVAGLSLNIITLFGLAVGIGMLVDNSIVVYESIESLMSRGLAPDDAVSRGFARSFRAILAASATNAVVFLPVAFMTEDLLLRGVLRLLALAILLPLAASVLVAFGLVPLLSHRLGTRAARSRIEKRQRQLASSAGLRPPQTWRALFSGLLVSGLRRPAGMLFAVGAAVALTMIVGLPWIAVSTVGREARDVEELVFEVRMPGSGSLEAAGEIFTRLEDAAMHLDGVRLVESVFGEQDGSLTLKLVGRDRRPAGFDPAKLRRELRKAVEDIRGIELRSKVNPAAASPGNGLGALFGGGKGEIRISGPDAKKLRVLALSLEKMLKTRPEISEVWSSAEAGMEEIDVQALPDRLQALGLMPEDVLPVLASVRREGTELQVGMGVAGGRDIPVVLRSRERNEPGATQKLEDLEIVTAVGIRNLGEVASIRRMPPPAVIEHHNGRREKSVYYKLASDAPRTGPAGRSLQQGIADAVAALHLPEGFVVETGNGPDPVSWFKSILLPVLLLLFAVLALSFESLSMPLLVLVTLPLTLLGAVWALVFSGTPAGLMALAGVVALLGLTVNPAILLVDRMQDAVRRGRSPGAAALAAVRERSRPVLMTSCTTIAGLWPLALSTGREMEIWPPFATVVMGGLLSSTLLTLLIIPMGFVFLSKLGALFGRMGPLVAGSWVGLSAAVMVPLIAGGVISSPLWQLMTTGLVAAILLAGFVLAFSRPYIPVPEGVPPSLNIRYLRKIYGRPGPIGRALAARAGFNRNIMEAGGEVSDRPELGFTVIRTLALSAFAAVLSTMSGGLWWKTVFALLAAAFFSSALAGIGRLRKGPGKRDARPGGIETLLGVAAPWFVLAALVLRYTLMPLVAGVPPRLPPIGALFWFAVIVIVQLGRRSARKTAAGLAPRSGGMVSRLWRRFALRVFGLDLPREEVCALSTISFRVEEGIVGILGPNGAGKTTLLRLLTGMLDPDLGRVTLGGIPMGELRKTLGRWVGYLPQDFGLPEKLTGREYLEYFGLLYELGTLDELRLRVDQLLHEVGLEDRAEEKIGGYSGGMKQRLAVARTLLRLPPIIVVDEPTAGLDPRERIRFRNLLGRLARNRIVLFSTHVVEDVALICNRVLVLRKGELVFDGNVRDLALKAEGMVWSLLQERDTQPPGRIIESGPAGEGRLRLRILAAEKPDPRAVAEVPSLEEGYLVLTEEL